MQVGIVLAALLFMQHVSELTEVRILSGEIADREGAENLRNGHIPPDVEVFSIRGAFFFAVVHKLMEIDRIMAKKPRALILDMKDVILMDASALHTLGQIMKECRVRGIRFMIAGLHAQPLTVLDQANQIEAIGQENLHADLASALSSSNSLAG